MGKFLRSETNKKIEEKAWQVFWQKFQKTSPAEMEKILSGILSSEERLILMRRLAVVALLDKGESYLEISRILGISHQTISAVKKGFFGSEYKTSKSVLKEKKSKELPLPISGGAEFMSGLIEYWSETSKRLPAYKGVGYRGGKRKLRKS